MAKQSIDYVEMLSGNKDITAINSKITRKKAYQAVLKYAALERTKQFALEYLIYTLDSRNVTDDVQFLVDSNDIDGNLQRTNLYQV